MNEQLDLVSEAQRLRDAGIATVLDNEAEVWRQLYRTHAESWFCGLGGGTIFDGERLRLELSVARELPEPHHPNVWSACASGVIRRWLKEGRIVSSGVTTAMLPSSHARLLRQYRKVAP